MLIGYARVSTKDQNPQLQLDALKAAGCDEIVPETASGKTRERPVLEQVLARLTEGDTLVVWKLDRLGRSVVDLANIVAELKQRGVGIRSLTDGIDTSTGGIAADLTLNVLAAVAQFERDLIRERVTNGLAAAAKEGRKGGRRFKLTNDDLDLLLDLWNRGVPVTSLAAKWGVDQATIYRSHKRALARREKAAGLTE